MKTNDLVSWMRQDALPLWTARGWDERFGGYVEELHPDGTVSDPGFKRVRVQGRQLFSFSTTALLGWHPGAAALADKGFDFIKTHCRAKDGSWARRLKTDGSILDAEMDLYDTAFIVLGLSTYYRLTQKEEARKLLEETLGMVKTKLSVPGGKGYFQSLGDKPHLRQNPHMHWFEAMLFAYDATKDERYLDEARMIYGLAQEHIIDRETGALREFFDRDWKPALEGGKVLVEPGHHYEWSWLLWKAGQVMEVDPALGKSVLGFADKYGINETTGLVYDQVNDQGELTQSTHRLWVQTETLRAWVIRSDAQGPQREKMVERTEGNILKYYLDLNPRGTWGDRLDVKGNLMKGPVPTSSLYHLTACITELATWRAGRKG